MADVATSAANIDMVRMAEQGGNPSTPASGFGQLFAKSDGLYFIGDGGTVYGPLLVATALADWTPSITQSVGVTFTNNYSKYQRIGNVVFVWFNASITSAGTGNNDIIIGGLPINNAAPSGSPIGTAFINDNGTAFYVGATYSLSTNQLTIRGHLETNDVGSDPNFALASGDDLKVFACYPIA